MNEDREIICAPEIHTVPALITTPFDHLGSAPTYPAAGVGPLHVEGHGAALAIHLVPMEGPSLIAAIPDTHLPQFREHLAAALAAIDAGEFDRPGGG